MQSGPRVRGPRFILRQRGADSQGLPQPRAGQVLCMVSYVAVANVVLIITVVVVLCCYCS